MYKFVKKSLFSLIWQSEKTPAKAVNYWIGTAFTKFFSLQDRLVGRRGQIFYHLKFFFHALFSNCLIMQQNSKDHFNF